MAVEAEKERRQEKMLKAADIARMWNVSKPRAYAMLASGQLPTVRIGRSVRVPESKLKAWIDEQVATAGNRDAD